MLIAISALLLVGLGQDAPPPTPDFGRDIVPVLQRSCGQCHIGSAMGKLRLDSTAAVLRGGASGPAIVPGHSADSLLVKRLQGADGKPRMPLGGQPISATEIDLIRRWIDGGHFEVPETSYAAAPQSAVFARQIRPLLAQRCYPCHG
jgi:hypothetical protein